MSAATLAAIELLTQLLANASKISAALQANPQGLTDEQWAQIKADNDAARAELVKAIQNS